MNGPTLTFINFNLRIKKKENEIRFRVNGLLLMFEQRFDRLRLYYLSENIYCILRAAQCVVLCLGLETISILVLKKNKKL